MTTRKQAPASNRLRRIPRYDVFSSQCPSRQALDRIADKWTGLIISRLAERPYRFGELRRDVQGISQKMLTQTLRGLEEDGLVSRRPLATVPVTVEYALTKLGQTLIGPIAAICAWAEDHMDDVLASRAARREGELRRETAKE